MKLTRNFFLVCWWSVSLSACRPPAEPQLASTKTEAEAPTSSEPPSSKQEENEGEGEGEGEGIAPQEAKPETLTYVDCGRHLGPAMSVCETLYFQAADPLKRLFGPDRADLEPTAERLRALIEESRDSEKHLAQLQLANIQSFQVREFSRACYANAEKSPSEAAISSKKAHDTRQDLASTLKKVLGAPETNENGLLLRLALTQSALAQFPEAQQSFRLVFEGKPPESHSALAHIGRAVALHHAGQDATSALSALAPPLASQEPRFTAFAAAKCLAGEWAEADGRPADARREYQSYLSWAELRDANSKPVALFRRQILERLQGLGQSAD